MIREKQIKSGRLFETSFYPVYDSGRRMKEKKERKEISSEEQQAYNRKRAEKKFIRLVNCNFDNEDIFLHLTYDPVNAPLSEEGARKDVTNYLRRIKRYRKKQGLPDLKYIYVLEQKVYKTGRYAGLVNWHCHMFMNGGGFTRDMAEDMWTKGMTNADRYQPDTFGPETAAKYLCKDPQGKKRFVTSKNLKKPVESKPKDGKVGRRTVEKMAKLHCDDKEYWERRYKGYNFIKCDAHYNEYNGHWYVSVVMFKHKSQQQVRKN